MNKNVDQVYQHTLVSILDTAIRSTNCQYEDKEVLSRLCVKTFDASLGETGWDTFTMAYNTCGPLDTVSVVCIRMFHVGCYMFQSNAILLLVSVFCSDI